MSWSQAPRGKPESGSLLIIDPIRIHDRGNAHFDPSLTSTQSPSDTIVASRPQYRSRLDPLRQKGTFRSASDLPPRTRDARLHPKSDPDGIDPLTSQPCDRYRHLRQDSHDIIPYRFAAVSIPLGSISTERRLSIFPRTTSTSSSGIGFHRRPAQDPVWIDPVPHVILVSTVPARTCLNSSLLHCVRSRLDRSCRRRLLLCVSESCYFTKKFFRKHLTRIIFFRIFAA